MPRSSHVRSGHVSLRIAGISIVLPYSARSLPPLGLDWQIQTDGLNNYDSGKPVTGITEGFFGEAPDQGAYESGGARWVPGVRGRAEQGAAADADEPPRWASPFGAEEDKHAEA